MECPFLVFLVDDVQFAIESDLVYRIERFDIVNLEYKEDVPSFYHVGDYVITLDWLMHSKIKKDQLRNFHRLILYRVNGKIRGIPSTELVKVENGNEENIALVPLAFRNGKALNWVRTFFLDDKRIIPVLNISNLHHFSSNRKK